MEWRLNTGNFDVGVNCIVRFSWKCCVILCCVIYLGERRGALVCHWVEATLVGWNRRHWLRCRQTDNNIVGNTTCSWQFWWRHVQTRQVKWFIVMLEDIIYSNLLTSYCVDVQPCLHCHLWQWILFSIFIVLLL